MDLIRHTIEGLIYDFPIEVMANQIIEKREDNIRGSGVYQDRYLAAI